MYASPVTRSPRLFMLLVLLLIGTTLARGVWASQQALHDTLPDIDPHRMAVLHGHYHHSDLDHFHDTEGQLSDAGHKMLHGISPIENQLNLPLVGVGLHKAHAAHLAYHLPAFTEPPLPGLYRPPRR